jgi:hypothetical protein
MVVCISIGYFTLNVMWSSSCSHSLVFRFEWELQHWLFWAFVIQMAEHRTFQPP